MAADAERRIAGASLRSDAHVPLSTLRFGARALSRTTPFRVGLSARLISSAKHYFELIKPERTLVNVMTAAAGFLLASRWQFGASLLIEALAGTALVIASGCVSNNLLDVKIDRKMQRTKRRALVTGAVSAKSALALAAALAASGFALLALVNWLTFWLGILAFVSYVFIYGLAKRKTIWSTLIGTLPGGLSLVAGYTAVTDRLDFTALLLFLAMLAWQMAHFYAISVNRRADYASASLPVWAVEKGVNSTRFQVIIWTLAFLVVSLALALATSSWLLALAMLAASGYWLKANLNGSKSWAVKSFSVSLTVMLVFCLALAVSPLV